MKRILAFVTAITLAFALTACGEGSETIERKKSNKNGGATLEVDMSLAYLSEQPNARTRNIEPILQTPGGVLLKNSNSENRVRLTHYNTQTGEFTEIERPNSDLKIRECVAFRLSGDRFGVLFDKERANHWNFDGDAIVEVYDAQANFLETIEIPTLEGDQRLRYCTDYAGGTDYLLYEYYNFEDASPMRTIAYNLETGEIKDISGDGFDVVTGASGAAYCFTYSDDQYFLSRINIEGGRLEPITFTEGLTGRYYNYTAGSGDYELYAFNGLDVKGIKVSGDTGEAEKIMDFAASDLIHSIYSSFELVASPDGTFFVRNDEDLWHCRKRSEEDIANTKAISLAGVNLTSDLKNLVVGYNRSQTDYHIFMVDYMDQINEDYVNHTDNGFTNHNAGSNTLLGIQTPDNETDAAVELFRQDLMNGIAPDIICTDNLPYAQFANKGLFLDMTPLMEQDERFNPDDYLMNFFDSMKYQGEQQTIAFSFYLNTIVGETEQVGDKMGRTADEYQTILQSVPDGMNGFGYTKEAYQNEFLTWMQNGFLDTETKTCSFDSPAFASLLEIGNGLMTEEEWWKKLNEAAQFSFGVSDYEKNAFLTVRSFANAANYHECYGGEHEFRDITLVGFPTVSDGANGGMFSAPYQLAINAMSAYPEEIWEIFMGMLSEDTQRSYDVNTTYNSFPVLRSALKEDLEVVTKGPNRVYYGGDGTSRSIGAIPMEEQDFLLDYMEHITQFYYADPTVSGIIQEETDKLFAGDQTAQEAANMIQSRASLYISEQY